MAILPTVINSFNCYSSGDKLLGVADEITLPDFNAMTAQITGAGIAGSVDVPITGFFDSMDFSISFRTLTDDTFKLTNAGKQVALVLRAAAQTTNTATGAIGNQGVRIAVRGYMKAFAPGSVKVGDAMNSSVTLSVTYILIEVGGDVKIELDKFNCKFVVDGRDVMAKRRSLT